MVTGRICGIEKNRNLAPLPAALHDPFIDPGLIKELIVSMRSLHMDNMPGHDRGLPSKIPQKKLPEEKNSQESKPKGSHPKSCSATH
jgi:hypothetical protein